MSNTPSWLSVHCLTIALCLVTTVDGLLRTLDEKAEHVETIYIQHEDSIHRSRRSTFEHPDELRMSFTVQNQPIRLRLKRHAQSASLPVYTIQNGRAVAKPILETPRVSFYHDPTFGATFIYTRNHNSSRPFDLDGSMFINGFEYILTPDRLVTWVGGNGAAHALKRLNSRLSFGLDGIDTRDPYTRYASQVRTSQRRTRRLQRQTHGARNSNGARRRRQSNRLEVHHIELSIVADYAVWKRFLEFSSGDPDLAFQELQQYYLFVAVMMDVRYGSVTEIDSTLKIRIVPVSLIVTDVQDEAVWVENYRVGRSFVQAINSLYALREWVRRGDGVPKADHTMLFSGYDLLGGRSDSSTIGVAFIGTACTFNSVSVIEEYFTGTSGTVSAHELGHSLDAEHDANYRACSDASANVMSTQAIFPTTPGRVSNPWRFSACSVDAFGAFLETAKCTKEKPKAFIRTSQTGGVYFSADEQCRLVMGQDSYFCRSVQARKGFGQMCRHLYCYLPDEPGYCGSIIASEFTSCGDGKWCEKGVCVADTYAPQAISDTCPQGDEPGYQCRPEDCSDQKVKDVYCCQTCALRNELTLLREVAYETNVYSQVTQHRPETAKQDRDPSTDTGSSLEPSGASVSLATATTLPTASTESGFHFRESSTLTPEVNSVETTGSDVPQNTHEPGTAGKFSSQPTIGSTTVRVQNTTQPPPPAAATKTITSLTTVTPTTSTPTTTTTTLFNVNNTDTVTLIPTYVSKQPETNIFTRTFSSTAKMSTRTTSTPASPPPTTTTAVSSTSASTQTELPPLFDFNNTNIITLTRTVPVSSENGNSVDTNGQLTTPRAPTGSSVPSSTRSSVPPSTRSFVPSSTRQTLSSTTSPVLSTTPGGTDVTPHSSPVFTVSPTPGLQGGDTAESDRTPTTLSTTPFSKDAKLQDDTSSATSTPVVPTSSSNTSPQQKTTPAKTTSTTESLETFTTLPTSPKSSISASIILQSLSTPAITQKTTTAAPTTTTTTRPTTLAPCDSIYCLCVRCYSCYANVCSMFVPGGFYFNYIYGRPFG